MDCRDGVYGCGAAGVKSTITPRCVKSWSLRLQLRGISRAFMRHFLSGDNTGEAAASFLGKGLPRNGHASSPLHLMCSIQTKLFKGLCVMFALARELAIRQGQA